MNPGLHLWYITQMGNYIAAIDGTEYVVIGFGITAIEMNPQHMPAS